MDTAKNRRLVITYEVVTPESAEHGDAAERGFVDDLGVEVSSVAEACATLEDDGALEPSSSSFHSGIWYSQYDGHTDFRTGAVTKHSYHPKGFTEEEERNLFEAVRALERKDKVKNANCLQWFEIIKKDYSVINGVIVSPGKFESEPLYAAYYASLDEDDSVYDEQDNELRSYVVSDAEKEVFPELSEVERVVLLEDDSGFVHQKTMSESEWNDLVKEMEQRYAP